MIPPGKTTLSRMQLAAQLEAERIEILEDGHVRFGDLSVPRPERIRLRDDFAGVVRLIDIILADDVLRGRLEDRLALALARQAVAPPPAAPPDTEIVAVDEEPASE